eukprot:TRINITY_DN2603_c0_g1_i2.p1 TRINITY_DN2603_c0_g1~~TRINITY_DN2603_c0_g1_i2.p1  ORF type:complete len:235 (-),score=31.04 TRINITY_DN2603_c0_g1_i2:35-715(-)
MEGEPIASYFVFEFPTFLFLIMNSTVIYLWLEITQNVNKVKDVKGSGMNSLLFLGWIVWDLFILLCFIGFIIAYYVSPSEENLPCSLHFVQLASKAKLDVSLAYVVFVAFLSIVMAFTFMVTGAMFLFPIILRLTSSHRLSEMHSKILIYTWSLMFIFAVCFVVKSILLLIAATSNFVVPVIVFAFLEQIPTAILLWYLRPPSFHRSSASTDDSSQKSKTFSTYTK